MSSAEPEFFAACRDRVDRCLQSLLDRNDVPDRLGDAMRYALLSGGKRLRPILVYATVDALDGDPAAADVASTAIELIHGYSLIHDDLPSMDDDELRRGRPTTHIAFDEATAILAGDALQALAFEQIASSGLAPEVSIAMIRNLAQAAGPAGMVGGQMIDLSMTGQNSDMDTLERMHLAKTGALISCCIDLGCRCAAAPDQVRTELLEFGSTLGLAFQIRDDILDAEGTPEITGKSTGIDARNSKSTYVTILGIEKAKRELERVMASGMSILEGIPADTRQLQAVARYIACRTH